MKTDKFARPKYPTYRNVDELTTSWPIWQLVVAGLIGGLILAGGEQLLEILLTILSDLS